MTAPTPLHGRDADLDLRDLIQAHVAGYKRGGSVHLVGELRAAGWAPKAEVLRGLLRALDAALRAEGVTDPVTLNRVSNRLLCGHPDGLAAALHGEEIPG